MSKKQIAPSILSADFSNLEKEIKQVELAGADLIHVDVMDGHFVPNLTIGPIVVESIRKHTKLNLDVHLMISEPARYIDAFARAGSNWLTIHQEADKNLIDTLKKIKALGCKAGVSINPSTDVVTVESVLSHVDHVLVMTVNPGFGGQKFMDEAAKKIKILSDLRVKNKFNFLIEVDGGISSKNAGPLSADGCDVFVAGSAIFKASNYKTAISEIRNQL